MYSPALRLHGTVYSEMKQLSFFALLVFTLVACNATSKGDFSNPEDNSDTVAVDKSDTIIIKHKHKQVYQRFNSPPEYGIFNVDIDWPVSYKNVNLSQLQQKLIELAFERNGSNIDAMIDAYCAPRPGGRIVTSIPDNVKKHEVPWYEDDLEIKCTQVAGRYVTFKINANTFNYESYPTYRRYVTFDLANQKIVEEKDVFSKNEESEYYAYKEVVFEYLYDALKGNLEEISHNGEIACFYFTDRYTVFLFDENLNGFKEVEVPNDEISEYMTDNGRRLIGIKGGAVQSQWVSWFDLPTQAEGIKWQIKGTLNSEGFYEDGSYLEITKGIYPPTKIEVYYWDKDRESVFFGDANFDGHVDVFIVSPAGARPITDLYLWDDTRHAFRDPEMELSDMMFFINKKKKALKSLGSGSAWENHETLFMPSGDGLKKVGTLRTCSPSCFDPYRMSYNGGYVYQIFDTNGSLIKQCNLRSQLPDEWRW